MNEPQDIVRHELIGLKAKITASTNPSNVGVIGEVVDETRNTLSIKTRRGIRSFPKDSNVFRFLIPSGDWVEVDGSILVSRPEDRIKKKFSKW
jgi:ribonuclease P protein subunit POP4